MSVHVGASGVVGCTLNRVTLGFIQYCVLGSPVLLQMLNWGFKIFTFLFCRMEWEEGRLAAAAQDLTTTAPRPHYQFHC